MLTDKILVGNTVVDGNLEGGILLRQIEISDCTDSYVNWLNDPEVNQYLETRWSVQDLQAITSFVKSQRENDHSILFAIVFANKHIGNIKIGPINRHHNHADISYFIGNKKLWNHGIATESIRLVCEFGFKELDLHRIEAGAYSKAIGSWKALEKNGFLREGTFRKQVLSENEYIDVYRYGFLQTEWRKNDEILH